MHSLFFACMALLGRMSYAVPMEIPPLVDEENQMTLTDSQVEPTDPFSYIDTHELNQVTDEELPQEFSIDMAPAINENERSLSLTEDFSQYFDSRIVGGTDAKQHYNPSMVALIIGWVFPSFTCGGSIITKKHVLTAAHCIQYDWHGHVLNSFHGRVGSNTWDKGGILVIFSCHKNHPEFDLFTIKNDIGVLTMETSLTFSDSIKPISLFHGKVGGGVSVHVTGWGSTSFGGCIPGNLQILRLWTLSPAECQQKWSEIANIWSPVVDPEQEICTFHSRHHGMCHGDSGSALICSKINKLCGVVSWGFPCAVDGPDVFVRPSAFIDFIESAIKEKCTRNEKKGIKTF